MVYPPIEPFQSGMLPVSGGHSLYWEASGNPQGKPALYLHGGPGGGIKTGHRRHFDPARFLIVSFEQRGCGRSRPLASAPEHDLTTNTTQALIADIEALRLHLGVEAWLLCGISWGTALALAYAQAHPQRATGLVLAAIHTPTVKAVEWMTESLRRLFPAEWDAFAQAAQAQPGQGLVDAYFARLTSPDAGVRDDAARAWCAWEDAHVSLDPATKPNPDFQDPSYRLVFATLVTHYWKHAGFLEHQALLENMPRIAHLPGVLIHGRLDVSSPLEMAWDLHRAWPGSEFFAVEGEGHGGEQIIGQFRRAIAGLSAA